MSSGTNYYHKYMKYKTKYLALTNQAGGFETAEQRRIRREQQERRQQSSASYGSYDRGAASTAMTGKRAVSPTAPQRQVSSAAAHRTATTAAYAKRGRDMGHRRTLEREDRRRSHSSSGWV